MISDLDQRGTIMLEYSPRSQASRSAEYRMSLVKSSRTTLFSVVRTSQI